MTHSAYRPYLDSFGRRKGKTLSDTRKQMLEDGLSRYGITLPEVNDAGEPVVWGGLSIGDIAPDFADAPVHLEIGFGAGEYLIHQAQNHPKTLFIGCEPFMNGVASCIADINTHGLKNVRLFPDDVRLLLPHLPPHSLDHIAILFNDPWRKPRHAKRRLVSHEFMAELSRYHKPSGALLLVTDHEDYGAWMLEHLLHSPHYDWDAQAQADWRNPPEGWVRTRYQQKMLHDDTPPLFIKATHAA